MHRAKRTLPLPVLAIAFAVTSAVAGPAFARGADVQLVPGRGLARRSLPPAGAATAAGAFAGGGGSTAVVRYDDGETDRGLGPVPESGDRIDAAMRFDLPRAGMTVSRISACFMRLGDDPNLDFTINFWAADGPNGTPGTLLASVPETASGVPQDQTGTFYDFDLGSQGIVMPATVVYAGIAISDATADDFFLCLDHDGGGTQPGYFDRNSSGTWRDLRTQDSAYTALMLRGLFTDDFDPAACSSDATTLCLHDGRFSVQVSWRGPSGKGGPGQVAPAVSPASGLFSFTAADDWEAMVKVLDRCATDQHYEVAIGGTTDDQFTFVVTDTASNVSRTYFNELGHPVAATIDREAFGTCP